MHNMRRTWLLAAMLLALVACGGGGGGGGDNTSPAGTTPPASSSTDDPDTSSVSIQEQLDSLAGLDFPTFTEQSFELLLRRWPESALSTGLDDVPLALNNITQDYEAETVSLAEGILELLASQAPAGDAQETLAEVYRFYLEDLIAGAAFTQYTYPASYFLNSVPSSTLFFFTDIHPLASPSDATDYVARLRSVDRKITDLVTVVRTAESNGIVMPRILLNASINRHRQLVTPDHQNNPYYTRLASAVSGLVSDATERDNLLEDARQVVTGEIIPAYSSLVAALENQVSLAPEAIGVGQFTGGQDYYNHALRHHTTSNLTADEIHELGLTELERIHSEMRTIFDALGYPAADSIADNLSRAASDSGFIQPGNIVPRYEAILSEAEAQLPAAFNVLPRAPLTVVGGPTGGFYVRPDPNGTRPGAFHAQNVNPEPAMLMKSLAYHEGVPGHHLQIALAQENGESLVQQIVTFTGFVEGWALYAERLALELGWYEGDPLGNLGRLQYEAFRAARLVVDTGIHARGWSFDRAASFFQANTGFSRGASENQIGRYAIWPGQATAYMVGMLEILRYREAQQAEAGFDLKVFHDTLLTRGAVPLTMLGND